MLLIVTGYKWKGTLIVNLAWSKSNYCCTKARLCQLYRPQHTPTDLFSSGPLSLLVRANSSLPLLCDVFELGKNAYSWLVATCNALWLTCLSVMCRRSIDTWAWAAFCVLVYCRVFTSSPLILHLRPLLQLSPLFHILLSVVIRLLVSLSDQKCVIRFSSSCSHYTHHICHFHS